MLQLILALILLTGCATHVDRLRDAQVAADHYYNTIEAVQTDEVIIATSKHGDVTWILYTSDTMRVQEYRRRHDTDPGNWYGLAWACGTKDDVHKIEMWVPCKRMRNRHLIVHPMVAGHETQHAIDFLIKQGCNPALWVLEEYYR